MNFDDFESVQFTPETASTEYVKGGKAGFVYVVCWVKGDDTVPFYVGQTTRIWGRLDDYYWAMFSACTDFRVGEAIKHLHSEGRQIAFKYKHCKDRLQEERRLIQELGNRHELLNTHPAFDYKATDEETQRRRVREFLLTHLTRSDAG